jgi:hypothetical protein
VGRRRTGGTVIVRVRGLRPMLDALGRPPPATDEVELVEVISTLSRRRWVLLGTAALVVAASVGFALVVEPKYQSSARILPLEHAEVVEQWLRSREAAEWVVADASSALTEALGDAARDPSAFSWRGSRVPSGDGLAPRLQEATAVRVELTERGVAAPIVLLVSVTLPGPPEASRDAAHAYVRSLEALRPSLEALAAQEAFANHYDGTNEEEARRLAESSARARTFWLSFDEPVTPRAPISPSLPVHVALGLLVGVALGTLLALVVDRVSTARSPVVRRQEALEREGDRDAAPPPGAP